MKLTNWSYELDRPRTLPSRPVYAGHERLTVAVGIPESLFHAINRARGRFPRERAHSMGMADAITNVLRSCPKEFP